LCIFGNNFKLVEFKYDKVIEQLTYFFIRCGLPCRMDTVKGYLWYLTDSYEHDECNRIYNNLNKNDIIIDTIFNYYLIRHTIKFKPIIEKYLSGDSYLSWCEYESPEKYLFGDLYSS